MRPKCVRALLSALLLWTGIAVAEPVLTYYSYNVGNDPTITYSGEIVYNPVLNRVWMSFTFLPDNPTGDDLVQFANSGTIGAIVGQSVLWTPGFTFVGFTNVYDADTASIIFYKQSSGNKLLKVDATTAVVTQITPSGGVYTSNYNKYGGANAKYYAFLASAVRIDVVNLAAGTSSLWSNTLPPGEASFNPDMTFSDAN
jgi:hypothetical protein